MKAACRQVQRKGKTLGFVATMGALHEGHLSLVRASKLRCEVTAVSIFVNPLQFGPSEDLAKYPRTLERDARLLDELGVDLLFVPGVEEMYPRARRPTCWWRNSATSSTALRVPDTFAESQPWWQNCLRLSARIAPSSARKTQPRLPCCARWSAISISTLSWWSAPSCAKKTGLP